MPTRGAGSAQAERKPHPYLESHAGVYSASRICVRPLPSDAYESPFTRADANGDGSIDVSDSVRIFQFLFVGARQPPCLDACDANDDGTVEITDGIHLLDRLFRQRPEPGDELTRSCASDATADELGCSSYDSCP